MYSVYFEVDSWIAPGTVCFQVEQRSFCPGKASPQSTTYHLVSQTQYSIKLRRITGSCNKHAREKHRTRSRKKERQKKRERKRVREKKKIE